MHKLFIRIEFRQCCLFINWIRHRSYLKCRTCYRLI